MLATMSWKLATMPGRRFWVSSALLLAACGSSPAVPAASCSELDRDAAAMATMMVGMNPGEPCLTCHSTMGRFTLAGNVYGDSAGTAPLEGVTLHVVDTNGAATDLMTASDGSFWSTASFAFPVSVSAIQCPQVHAMPGTAANGDCNGCHTAGLRIHLP